jgi:hypothetical protein
MARQTAMARAAAAARQADLAGRYASDSARLDAADRAYQGGDVMLASRIYVSLALAREKTPGSVQARQRLDRLAADAQQKLQKIDDELAAALSGMSPSESLGLNMPQDGAASDDGWSDLVQAAFDRYDQLAEDYGGVPAMKRELKSHVARQRRRPEFARVLKEPEAGTLLELARKHEREDHACCAYWVYQEAARLVPAPSARLAQERYDQMQQDPRVVAAAESCRQLQECHRLYQRAEMLAEMRPERAKELFDQIIDVAPEDSEVGRAARQQLALLR